MTTTQNKNLMNRAFLPRFQQIKKKSIWERNRLFIYPKSITTLLKISGPTQKRKKGDNMVAKEFCYTFT